MPPAKGYPQQLLRLKHDTKTKRNEVSLGKRRRDDPKLANRERLFVHVLERTRERLKRHGYVIDPEHLEQATEAFAKNMRAHAERADKREHFVQTLMQRGMSEWMARQVAEGRRSERRAAVHRLRQKAKQAKQL